MKPILELIKAKPLLDPAAERIYALQNILLLRREASRFIEKGDPVDLVSGASQISLLRTGIYENINQLLHEVLVLEAQRRLEQEERYSNLTWYWHPRQTSGPFETDLMGWKDLDLMVVVEANTSAKHTGVIRGRVRKALENLAAVQHAADRYFFCTSAACAAAAERRIETEQSLQGIQVRCLDPNITE
jgi:hypothetical protein